MHSLQLLHFMALFFIYLHNPSKVMGELARCGNQFVDILRKIRILRKFSNKATKASKAREWFPCFIFTIMVYCTEILL